MKILIDFFPILLFFGAYKAFGIYVGTGVLMAATCVQMGIIYATERKLSTMHQITLGLILVFGGLTLVLQNENLIKWKPTVLYAAMAIALAVAQWIFRKNVLQTLLGQQLELPVPVWNRLVVAWVLYNAFMSAVNAFVVLNYSTEEWVNFKLWGYIFPLLFIVGQGIYIAPHLKDLKEPQS